MNVINEKLTLDGINFGECQSLWTSLAAEYRSKGLDRKAAHHKAAEDVANILGLNVDSFKSQMGRLRNKIGNGRKISRPRAAANHGKNGNGGGLVLAGMGVYPLSPVQATLFPIKETRIVPVEKKKEEKPIGHFVRLELERVNPKSGERVEMEFLDEKTAKDARARLGWVVRSLGWASYRSDLKGKFLYITRG